MLVTHDAEIAALADARLTLRDGRPVPDATTAAGGSDAMRFVLVMAGREMRASWRRLVFFFLCIALGVGAIVTLRSVIQSVRQVFAGEARALIGADLVVSSSRPIDGEVAAPHRHAPAGRRAPAVTRTAETATMARAAGAASRRRRGWSS